jgi:hypothetical protein
MAVLGFEHQAFGEVSRQEIYQVSYALVYLCIYMQKKQILMTQGRSSSKMLFSSK